MASLNVLVTAASRRVPLIRAFQDALKSSAVPGRVIVTDVNPLVAGGAHRRTLVSRAAGHRARLPRRDQQHLRTPSTSA